MSRPNARFDAPPGAWALGARMRVMVQGSRLSELRVISKDERVLHVENPDAPPRCDEGGDVYLCWLEHTVIAVGVGDAALELRTRSGVLIDDRFIGVRAPDRIVLTALPEEDIEIATPDDDLWLVDSGESLVLRAAVFADITQLSGAHLRASIAGVSPACLAGDAASHVEIPALGPGDRVLHVETVDEPPIERRVVLRGVSAPSVVRSLDVELVTLTGRRAARGIEALHAVARDEEGNVVHGVRAITWIADFTVGVGSLLENYRNHYAPRALRVEMRAADGTTIRHSFEIRPEGLDVRDPPSPGRLCDLQAPP